MAKGSRASTKKANNARLKSGVFGPVETARTERLSAKLLELASQPKPKQESVLEDVEDGMDLVPGCISRADKCSESTDANPASQTSGVKQAEGTQSGRPFYFTFTNHKTLDMEVDQDRMKSTTQSKRGRIEKKRVKSSRKASIVFPKYKSSAGKPKGRSKR